jgi:hypothetical protein
VAQLHEEVGAPTPEDGAVDEYVERLTNTAVEEIFKHFSLQATDRAVLAAVRA